MSGGFYKYRCKYFYTHNCQNWAEGRDEEKVSGPVSMMSRDISVPRVQNGILQYTIMKVVAPTRPGDYWTLRDKDVRPPPPLSFTSAMPASLSLVSVGYEEQPSDSDFPILPHSQNMTNYHHSRTFR
ncbi:hypothetical protein E4U54_002799 [Claviceps lovelessii]|nr:hypothetical protein E4U54_002799 [Claviceps lovelessii]